MFCPKCAHDNPDEARFCGKCGTSMPVAAGASPPAVPTTAAPTQARVSEGLKWGVFFGTLIVPLLGLIMGGIYWSNASPSKKAVGKLWLFTGVAAFIVQLGMMSSGGW